MSFGRLMNHASGDTSIERVERWEGRAITDARVYAVAYESTGERFFFWMQVFPRLRSISMVAWSHCIHLPVLDRFAILPDNRQHKGAPARTQEPTLEADDVLYNRVRHVVR
jgi:hypothetical protein